MQCRPHSNEFRALEADLRRIAAANPGVTLDLTGTSVVAARSFTQAVKSLALGRSLASLAIFAAMAAKLRSVMLGLLGLLGLLGVAPNALPLVAAAAALIAAGVPLGLTGTAAFCVALGLAVDDTVHVLFRFRAERARGRKPVAAARRAAAVVGPPALATTGIFLAGLVGVAMNPLPGLREYGLLCAGMLAAGTLAELTVTPGLLACLPSDWIGGTGPAGLPTGLGQIRGFIRRRSSPGAESSRHSGPSVQIVTERTGHPYCARKEPLAGKFRTSGIGDRVCIRRFRWPRPEARPVWLVGLTLLEE